MEEQSMTHEVSGEASREGSVANSFVANQSVSQNLNHTNDGMGIKPSFVPTKFWDPVKKEVRLSALMRSYKDMEKKLSSLLSQGATKKAPVMEIPATNRGGQHRCPASAHDYIIDVDHEMFDNDPWINFYMKQALVMNKRNWSMTLPQQNYFPSQKR